MLAVSFLFSLTAKAQNINHLQHYSTNFDLNYESCTNLPHTVPLVYEYMRLWKNPYAEVPQISSDIDRVRLENVKACILDQAFQSMFIYGNQIEYISQLIEKYAEDDQKTQALMSIMLEFNWRWEHEMSHLKAIREDEKISSQFKYAASAGALVLTGFFHRNLAKLTEFRKMGMFLTNPSRVRLLFGQSAKMAQHIKNPSVLRAGYISAGLGGSGAQGLNEIQEQKAQENTGPFNSVTGDIHRQVWSSPFYILDKIVDHSSNEHNSYKSYDFWKDIQSIIAGSIASIVVHETLIHPLQHRLKLDQRVINFLQGRYGKGAQPGRLVRGAGLAADFGMVLGISVLAFFQTYSTYKKTSDRVREFTYTGEINLPFYQYEGKLLSAKRKLERIEGPYWQNRLHIIGNQEDLQSNNLLYDNSDNFQPTIANPDPERDYETLISAGLLDAAYEYKYAVESLAEHYRGKVEIAQNDVIESFQHQYICTGNRYHQFVYDQIDEKNGVEFYDNHFFTTRSRAQQLSEVGDIKLKRMEENLLRDLEILRSDRRARYQESLEKSIEAYDEAISFLTDVMHRSGRYFLSSIILQLELSKESEIYNFQPETYHERTITIAGHALNSILMDREMRNEFSCGASRRQIRYEKMKTQFGEFVDQIPGSYLVN